MGSEGLELVPYTWEHDWWQPGIWSTPINIDVAFYNARAPSQHMEISWKQPAHSTEHARKGY